MHYAKLTVYLREDHVEMYGRLFAGHDDDYQVRHFGFPENDVREVVDSGWAGSLAEPDDERIATQRMNVAPLERIVQPVLSRAVIQYSPVRDTRVVHEDRLHQELFGPSNAVAHRAYHDVVVDAHGHVAREEQVRQRGKDEAALVECARQLAWRLLDSFDQRANELGRVHFLQLARKRLRRDDVQRVGHEPAASLLIAHHLGKQILDAMHSRKPLEDGDEPGMLTLCPADFHDVVVQVVGACRRGYGEQLVAGGVDENFVKLADL